MKRRSGMLMVVFICIIVLLASGCSRQKELEQINRSQAATILSLNDEITRLNDELEDLTRSREQLEKTQLMLQDRLREELEKGDLKVSMEDKGLVVTVLNKILFDSGKTNLKSTSVSTLQKVGDILKNDVPQQLILIEGHTDTDPIKRSGFKSNWELSTTRATEVVHFFIKNSGINPERLVALGYGEYQPLASNATSVGKSQNRRVEIVISPKQFVRKSLSTGSEQEGLR